MHGGGTDLVEVKTADVGRHGDTDAFVGRDQDVGERRGQQARLFHGAVVAVNKIHRVLVDILKDFGADGRELGLGVTRGGVAQVTRIIFAKLPFDSTKERAVLRCPWQGAPSFRRWRHRRAG